MNKAVTRVVYEVSFKHTFNYNSFNYNIVVYEVSDIVL